MPQAVLLIRSDPVFPLVFVWACCSIRTYHHDDETVRAAARLGPTVVLAADVAFVIAQLARRARSEGDEASPFLG